MRFIYDDGGRSKYFKATNVGDCVTRAIANATGVDYKEVYDALNALAKEERTGKRKRGKSKARDGVYNATYRKYIEGELGWVWVPCMSIGSGCKTHLRDGELPQKGNYVVRTSHHLTCVRDGALVDTYDCSRDGDRCVYGYWRAPTEEERKAHEETKTEVESFERFKENAKAELKAKREVVKRKNDAIRKSYAKRIAKLKRQIAKLEKERDSKLLPMLETKNGSFAYASINVKAQPCA